MIVDLDYLKNKYNSRRVLVTGHTGFKGSWLTLILQMIGANVIGYALEPNTEPSLFNLLDLKKNMVSIYDDIRNLDNLNSVFMKYKPEYVFHLAAQPIVRESYDRPVETYSTNVMGTVNVLECIRQSESVLSALNVTTDKVYRNIEKKEGYVESDLLDGYDPYSNSKSCSELITNSYRNAFFKEKKVPISTARAGNVIGGGDFAKDRIIPDCIRAALQNEKIIVRNPNSVRPYQHVLEPLIAYLMIAGEQLENPEYQGAYNVGPKEEDSITTGVLVKYFCKQWGEELDWKVQCENGLHEAHILRLDCSKLRDTFEWETKWNVYKAIDKTIEWSKNYRKNGNIIDCMKHQILDYLA